MLPVALLLTTKVISHTQNNEPLSLRTLSISKWSGIALVTAPPSTYSPGKNLIGLYVLIEKLLFWPYGPLHRRRLP